MLMRRLRRLLAIVASKTKIDSRIIAIGIFYMTVALSARIYLIYNSAIYILGGLWFFSHMTGVASFFSGLAGFVASVKLVDTWKPSDIVKKGVDWTATIPLCAIGIAGQLYIIANTSNMDKIESSLLFIVALLVRAVDALIMSRILGPHLNTDVKLPFK